MKDYQEGDSILCTVERIEPNSVFVKLPDNREGTLIISEIAPGRIKNLREYVVPNKKIVCKILRISGNRIDVSLRRVNSKERSEIMEKYKQEQTSKSAFNQILKENARDAEAKILQDFQSIYEFISQARENTSLISKYIPEKFTESFSKILQKKQKDIESKKNFSLKCLSDDGISKIKKVLSFEANNIKILYLSAGNFQISIKAENYKIANQKMTQILEDLEKRAKTSQCEFQVIEK
jgi:translation initiation factor 2 subunit 1